MSATGLQDGDFVSGQRKFAKVSELLRTYSRIRTTDIEEFSSVTAADYGSHRLDPYPHRTRGLSVFNTVRLGDIALSYSHLGVPARIRHEPQESFVLIRFSLSGSVTVHRARSEQQFDRNAAAIFNPDATYDMSKQSGVQALVLRVERDALEAELQRVLGRPPRQRLRLDSSLDMTTPRAKSLLSSLRGLCTDLDGPRGVIHPAMRQPLQRFIITQLLTTVNHSATDELAAADFTTSKRLQPSVIRRADQLIADHCREPLTVSDIAEAVGISVRSLQNGFRQHLNTTPKQRLRQARLAGVRAELLASDPTVVTASRIASDWGFLHIGRFSQHYRLAFGESPAQTLRR